MRNLILFSLLLANIIATGQSKKLSLDPAVRYGKLSNGLTYYIRHNEEPKGRTSFYLVQNVGAILEEDDQNGLAHMLEHLAFNGTKHFPKKGILDYLEGKGLKFGADINAYTSTDETVYNISNLPTPEGANVDSALLVLSDWCNYLLLQDDEIDMERGVIKEEWRSRNTPGRRMQKELMPVIYRGAKYQYRDVIGDMKIVESTPHQAIRSYYEKWYRSDLQSVIVVGDINVDEVEKKVKQQFSTIPAVKNATPRVFYDVPINKELEFGMVTDPEATNSTVTLMYLQNTIKKNEKEDAAYLKRGMEHSLYISMLRSRFAEIANDPSAPYRRVAVYYTGYTPTIDAYMYYASPKNEKVKETITRVITEQERLERHGFTEGELKRAKADLMKSYKNYFLERSKVTHDQFAQEYQRHYLSNEPAPGVEYEYEYAKEMIPQIKLEDLNKLAKRWIATNDPIITIAGPEKEKSTYPDKRWVAQLINDRDKLEVKAYEDSQVGEVLISTEVTGSKVAETLMLKELEAEEWVLANGLRVFIKPTDHNDNEILLSAYSYGGTSLLSQEQLPSAHYVMSLVGQSGLGEFDKTSLKKVLTGKDATIMPYLNTYSEGFNGSCTPSDLETMLQQVYLYFESPRFDEQAFTILVEQARNGLKNKEKDHMRAFRDTLSQVMSNKHPRSLIVDESFITKVKYETIKEIYRDRFKDVSDFVFVLTGNIDKLKVKPLIEQYLGAITDSPQAENWKDHQIRPQSGLVEKDIYRVMEVPSATNYHNFHSKSTYNEKDRIYLGVIAKLLQKRYMTVIREEEGGSYGVSVNANFSRVPYDRFNIVVYYQCDPSKADKFKGIVNDEFDKFINLGPDPDDLNEIKKSLLEDRKTAKEGNRYWESVMVNYSKYRVDLSDPKQYEEIVTGIDETKVQEAAARLLNDVSRIQVIMKPEVL